MTVFTIGYKGLNIDDFMSLLDGYDIETVVDVRELPLSRKSGFSKRALAGILHLSGIEYIHMIELGCPRPVRNEYRADGNWRRYTASFLNYLKTQQNSIEKLAERVQSSTCALLCFEADFNFCHRSMVADALSRQCGAQIRHIPVVRQTKASESRQLAFA